MHRKVVATVLTFRFDIKKSIAAVAFLMKREGGDLDMFLGLKMLYLADKQALTSWGKTITGDSFVSMPKGPVLSEVYDLFRGSAPREDQREWDAFFSERVNHSIHLLKHVDIELLSVREMEILEGARKQIRSVAPWEVAEWLHKTCPEWEDPNGGSTPIDPSTILRHAGKNEAEIQLVDESTQALDYAKRLVGI